VEVTEFVLAELPSPPSRVLEVGCGSGELARALAKAGHDVLAVDPEAPTGPLFRRTTIEELDVPGPFDAVVASRSLHHVDDLGRALDKIAGLLVAGGSVILDEFAWERFDPRSAAKVGIEHDDWCREHADLHTSAVMIREFDERFARRVLSWGPSLYRESRRAVSEDEERELLERGEIQPIGFRYVGFRQAAV
jgi:2-polyprenyl-3-methyl-5-hydroxy-6-metoxy-1,4-benzoquinol methylase